MKKIRPSDSFCIVGWSSLDLYPSPELNFVLGEACFDSGCAVISFGCYADATKPGAENTFDTMHDKLQNINQASCACDSYTSVKYPHWNCTDLGDEIVWRVLKVQYVYKIDPMDMLVKLRLCLTAIMINTYNWYPIPNYIVAC